MEKSFRGFAAGGFRVGTRMQLTDCIGHELNRKLEFGPGWMPAAAAAARPPTPLTVPLRLVLPVAPARLISRFCTKMLPDAVPVPISRIIQVLAPVSPPVGEKVTL